MDRKAYNKKWREENPEKSKESSRKWREKNPEKSKEASRKWREENPEYSSIASRKWREENPEKAKKYFNERYANNIQFKLSKLVRGRLGKAISREQKVGSAVHDLGCTLEELKIHLENQFKEGMTWDNWKPDGWHIDHIKPLSKFDLTDPVQFKEAVHYTNLQPLWWNENLEKSDKWVDITSEFMRFNSGLG